MSELGGKKSDAKAAIVERREALAATEKVFAPFNPHHCIAIASQHLTSITSGADARTPLLTDALNSRFGDDGVVKMLAPPRYTNCGHGISHATGRVDINALWSGDTKRSFTADVDPRNHRVANLRTKLIASEACSRAIRVWYGGYGVRY